MKPLANLDKYSLILASQSPRRQYLLKELGLHYQVRLKSVDEIFPDELKAEQIPLYLSNLKAEAFAPELKDNELVITADTVVWIDNHVLNKPANEQEAIEMIRMLSGKMHQVFTGVTLMTKAKKHSFFAQTNVYFRTLSEAEIEFYVHTYKPLDKAGAYGAQEWIGYVGVERIEGTYFNVMGLPLAELYKELSEF